MLHADRVFLNVPLTPPISGRRLPPRAPAPCYRHGTPSGPWPFLDIDDEVDPERIEDPESHRPMSASACIHRKNPDQEFCWCKYPQALFPNWTPRQQKKSKILKVVEKAKGLCRVYYIDVKNDGTFWPNPVREVDEHRLDSHWHLMTHERPKGSRVRVVFVDNLTGPILQMLGMRYNIEPFFFSSTIGWIPSRFQSNVTPGDSDHITITLSFIRSIDNPEFDLPSPHSSYASAVSRVARAANLIIDTQAPLPLRSSDLVLIPDFLSVHMIRSLENSTIISCHSGRNHLTTKAEVLFERFHLTGKSVYWSSIFEMTHDPTFLIISILWYVMYAWDETFEALYSHICFLEEEVMTTNDMKLTHELHAIRAHLLHYESLLAEFKKSVEFVYHTPNPCLENPKAFPPELKETTESLISRECENLIHGIVRLERSRLMQDKRLKNVMGLSFSLVNIEDSKRMKELTEAAIRDSAAMKQVAYLTMFFLPAGFVAAVFGMNIGEINPQSAKSMTLAKYFAVALPLTAFTIWIIVAYQIQIEDPRAALLEEQHAKGGTLATYEGASRLEARKYRRLGIWSRLLWPFFLFLSVFERRRLVERAKRTPVGLPATYPI